MKIASIDVGTNTVLLLIATIDDAGTLMPLVQERRFARLGEGLDASGLISPQAMQRLIDALLEYKKIIEQHNVETVIIGATSASRDAQNKETLVQLVKEETGFDYQIISGDEEALLSFTGALALCPEAQDECVIIDIGGGSTEVIWGNAHTKTIHFETSFQLGSTRLKERFFDAIPPSENAIAEATSFILSTFEDLPQFPANAHFIAVAGTASSLALTQAGESHWSSLSEAQKHLSQKAIFDWTHKILGLTPNEVLALNPPVLNGRHDIFGMAVLILQCFLKHTNFTTCRATSGGLRHGLALAWWQKNNKNK